jgi:hypothetical protein
VRRCGYGPRRPLAARPCVSCEARSPPSRLHCAKARVHCSRSIRLSEPRGATGPAWSADSTPQARRATRTRGVLGKTWKCLLRVVTDFRVLDPSPGSRCKPWAFEAASGTGELFAGVMKIFSLLGEYRVTSRVANRSVLSRPEQDVRAFIVALVAREVSSSTEHSGRVGPSDETQVAACGRVCSGRFVDEVRCIRPEWAEALGHALRGHAAAFRVGVYARGAYHAVGRPWE